MRIGVERAGWLTTVQDLGRPGYQRQGVTVGGAMDAPALRVANLLVGNAEDEAGLELTGAGPALRFPEDALVAWCGADLDARIGGKPVPGWRPVAVRAGARLDFGGRRRGWRACVAVAGGVAVAPVLGSRSTDLRAGWGGLGGRALRAGDTVPVGPPSGGSLRRLARALAGGAGGGFRAAGWRAAPEFDATPGAGPVVLRAMRLPAWEEFAADDRARFFEDAYEVTDGCDRMGYRLRGPPLRRAVPGEPVSEAVCAGVVQVPADGQPLLLMADRQTVGGYPKIACVIAADLSRAAQAGPGDRLRFRAVTAEAAVAAHRARESALGRLRQAADLREDDAWTGWT